MITGELAKKMRYIQIATRRAVDDVLAGEYHSVFKGRGIEFDEVREYAPGDEIRSIDWNVTARTGTPYVKRYIEERDLTVLFLVDCSGSGDFGTVRQTKSELAAEVCALLALSAVKNNDKAGLLLFTDAVERYIPPKKGVGHVMRLVREVLSFRPRRRGTDIAAALDYMARVTHRRAVVFLLSDFLDQGYERALRICARRHDLVALPIRDPREEELPPMGIVTLEDGESGETVTLDTSSRQTRRAYAAHARERHATLLNGLRRLRVDTAPLTTGEDSLRPLIQFFRGRERRQATA